MPKKIVAKKRDYTRKKSTVARGSKSQKSSRKIDKHIVGAAILGILLSIALIVYYNFFDY